jgi:hypothetical protein
VTVHVVSSLIGIRFGTGWSLGRSRCPVADHQAPIGRRSADRARAAQSESGEHGRPSVVRFIKLEVIDLACPPGVDIMICRAFSTTDIRA